MARQAALHRKSKLAHLRHDGKPSVFTCPDCQGTLFVIHRQNLGQFQCRVGHLYSPESMMEAQNENVERLMWGTARALEEQGEYMSQVADQADGEDSTMARNYLRKALSAMQKADALQKLITRR